MPEYVIKSGKIRKEDRTYLPGETIELAEEVAKALPQKRLVTLQVTGSPIPLIPREPPVQPDIPEEPPEQEVEVPAAPQGPPVRVPDQISRNKTHRR